MKTKILLVAALATSVLPTARLAIAEEAAATKTEKIESVDLEKTFGPVPRRRNRCALLTSPKP